LSKLEVEYADNTKIKCNLKKRGAKVYEVRTSNYHSASKKNATQESGENLYLSIAFF
jgi:hypothetical protein